MAKIKRRQPSTKGGKRSPNVLKYGAQRLLKILWEKKGGPHSMKRLTGEPAQAFIGWRNKGKVSLKKVGKLSRLLNVKKEALNFEEVGEFNGTNNTWSTIVRLTLDNDKEIEWVLKGVWPKEFAGDR